MNLIKVILAIVIISFGIIHISQPSNLEVYIGVGEVIIAMVLLYGPIKQLIKNLNNEQL